MDSNEINLGQLRAAQAIALQLAEIARLLAIIAADRPFIAQPPSTTSRKKPERADAPV